MPNMQDSDRITSTTLNDGTVVKINDHVYLAPEFTGESFYVGRVMEFGKKVNGKTTQVRIGWFYRPKDVMQRRNNDPRLLVATMHSDMNPLTSIRGLCVITHQAYIQDLEAYKKRPDHFYYSQLFDRYIHRIYDIIPVSTVRNMPSDVAQELSRRYEFIIIDLGTTTEFTDAHRVCLICKRWCASGEALKCIMCQGFHHMLCINPPMLKKPTKGFAFQCALCTKMAQDPSASPPSNHLHSSLNSGQNTPRGSPKQKPIGVINVLANASTALIPSAKGARLAKTTNGSNLEYNNAPQKMSHMWPFRYFGAHADIHDIFDPDDRVYPRASSREGPRYQAVTPKWEKPGQMLAMSTVFDDPKYQRGKAKKGRGGRPPNKLKALEAEGGAAPKAFSGSLDVLQDDDSSVPSSPSKSGQLAEEPVYQERGGDDTVTLLYNKPPEVSEEYVKAFLDRVRQLDLRLPLHSADIMDRAMLALQNNNFDADKAMDEVEKLRPAEYVTRDWTLAEIELFEEGIRQFGHELFAIKTKVATRSMKDIVRFFYSWKKTDRYQPVYSVFTKVNKPNKKFKAVGRKIVTSPTNAQGTRTGAAQNGHEEEEEVIPENDAVVYPGEDEEFECANCGTMDSPRWRKAPGELERNSTQPRVYCMECGDEWVRYATLPPAAELLKENRKWNRVAREMAANKSTVHSQGNGSSTKGSQHHHHHQDHPLRNHSHNHSHNHNHNGNDHGNSNYHSNHFLRATSNNNNNNNNTYNDYHHNYSHNQSQHHGNHLHHNNNINSHHHHTSTFYDHEALHGNKRKRDLRAMEPPAMAPSSSSSSTGYKKRAKGEFSSTATRSPSPQTGTPCAVCNTRGTDEEPLLVCNDCSLSVHRDCYGTELPANDQPWQCDPCLNNQNPVCSTFYKCVLCPVDAQPSSKPQALKRTSGHFWAHILCAIWVPEVQFVDIRTFSPVESIGYIRQDRYKQTCYICKQNYSGACVSCSVEHCPKKFHVTCARNAGYNVALEMQSAAKSFKINTSNGNGHGGSAIGSTMAAVIYCPQHDLTGKKFIQFRDQPDADTDLNALVTFAKYYKQCDTAVPPAMRKSRLLVAMNPVLANPNYNDVSHHNNNIPMMNNGSNESSLAASPATTFSSSSLSSFSGPPKQESSADMFYTSSNGAVKQHFTSPLSRPSIENTVSESLAKDNLPRRQYHCQDCGTQVSPIWWDPIRPDQQEASVAESSEKMEVDDTTTTTVTAAADTSVTMEEPEAEKSTSKAEGEEGGEEAEPLETIEDSHDEEDDNDHHNNDDHDEAEEEKKSLLSLQERKRKIAEEREKELLAIAQQEEQDSIKLCHACYWDKKPISPLMDMVADEGDEDEEGKPEVHEIEDDDQDDKQPPPLPSVQPTAKHGDEVMALSDSA